MSNFKGGVQGCTHLLHYFTQIAQAFKRKVLALHGSQNGIGRHESVNGKAAQGRRAVHQDVIPIVANSIDGVLQARLGEHFGHQLSFDFGQHLACRRRSNEQVLLSRRLHNGVKGFLPAKNLGDGGRILRGVNAKSGGCIALRVKVDNQCSKAQLGQRGT